ncbi:MAG: vanadium-dependent haloperoxidase [Bryobacteraceae bacterium]
MSAQTVAAVITPPPSALAPAAGTQATSPVTNNRLTRSLACRMETAARNSFQIAPAQLDNGDEALYADKCGTYTKGVLQKGIGLVDITAYQAFKKALSTGDSKDFEQIPLGGTRTLNGPQGGLAFDLEGLDSSQFVVPPAPAVATEEYATELIELYWGSLLRDVAFTDYATNPLAAEAADELSAMPAYKGPRDPVTGKVTPELLFRGGLSDGSFAGETIGPYLSQFLLKQADFGAFPFNQRYVTFKSGIDYVTDEAEFLKVQNGAPTGQAIQRDPAVYLHDGRGLAAWTHEDVLYQAYFMAYLVLDSIGAPPNPGNPYGMFVTQNGFNTLGPPDIASTLAAVASEALKAVWYQKWYVHLRHRPESGGGLVHLTKTGKSDTIQCQLSPTVLESRAVQSSFDKYNSYFLSQAFPEGSPTHPAYPTGHGTVAGACMTVLKFFFDGGFHIPNAQVPSNDGTSLQPYTGGDVGDLTVNGELHKLAHNVSFGHGIHAGIHWRSDTDTSIQLGEAVALSVLKDRALTYNEKFTIQLRKVDGSIATITNQ